MLKKLLIAICLTGISPTLTYASSYDDDFNCDIKIEKIKKQINYAKKFGNKYRERGLKRALQRVERKCGIESTELSREKPER